jgi:hypothetical protein
VVDIDFRDRDYLSRYSRDVIGFRIYQDGEPTDPTDDAVTVTLWDERVPPVLIGTHAAEKVDVGDYTVQLSSQDTKTPGNVTMRWSYSLGAGPELYEQYFVIGEVSPAFDNLPPAMKDVVESVWRRFSNCFDSPHGGPNLQTYFQAHWDRGRIARCLRWAMNRLNAAAQPMMTYTTDGQGGEQFPFDQWGGVLEMSTYVEALKDLVRSYVEQPELQQGTSITRHDRRDYMTRWMQMLGAEEQLLNKEFEVFKIQHMGFGKPRVLVSGGVFSRYGPTRVAYSIAARPRYYTRWY